MATNASFHKLQVLVGDDLQDWSEALISFEAGDSERDDSGLITSRGRLILGLIRNAPSTMNPRSQEGRALWYKGQKVVINVTDSTGAMIRHPRGWLYVSKPPLPPTPDSPYLELELADVLQFRTYPQPRGQVTTPEYQYTAQSPLDQQSFPNASSIGYSTPTSVTATLRNNAISTALYKPSTDPYSNLSAGIPNEFVGNVEKYPVASPLYSSSDGYVQFAGAVAFGGIEALYQRNDGKIDSISLAMRPPESPIATVELGVHELLWECTEGGETPVERVLYDGSFTGIKPADQGDPNDESSTIDYGPGSLVDPDLGSQKIVIRQTIRTGIANPQYKASIVIVRAPLGMVSDLAYPKSTALGLESKSTTEYFYDLADGGRLKRIVLTERMLFPKACESAFSRMNATDKAIFAGYEIVSKITETLYFYDAFTGIIREIQITTQEPQAAIATDENFADPVKLVPSEVVTTTWVENRKGEWKEVVIVDRSLVRTTQGKDLRIDEPDPDKKASIKLSLTRQSYQESDSNSGQNQPPAAERSPIQFESQEIPISGSAKFTAPKGPFNERYRTYNLEVGCVSVAQLQELAQIKGAELFGRAQGARIQLPLRDEFLNNPQPLNYLAVIEPELQPSGWRKNLGLYQLDGMQYTHGEGQAVVTASLIWIGTIQGALADYD